MKLEERLRPLRRWLEDQGARWVWHAQTGRASEFPSVDHDLEGYVVDGRMLVVVIHDAGWDILTGIEALDTTATLADAAARLRPPPADFEKADRELTQAAVNVAQVVNELVSVCPDEPLGSIPDIREALTAYSSASHALLVAAGGPRS